MKDDLQLQTIALAALAVFQFFLIIVIGCACALNWLSAERNHESTRLNHQNLMLLDERVSRLEQK